MNKANECTCPSGDGSLVHPCPAHPAVEQAGANVGHGHVFPRADGVKMRCGGPGLCSECTADASRARAALAQPSPASDLDPFNLAPHAEAFNEAPAEALKPEQAEAERPEQPKRHTADVFYHNHFSTVQMEVVRASDFDEFAAQHERISAQLHDALDECDGDRWKLRSERDAALAEVKRNKLTIAAMNEAHAKLAADLEAVQARVAELEKQEPAGAPMPDEIHQMAFEEGQPAEDGDGYLFSAEEFDLFVQRLLDSCAAPVAQAQHSVPEEFSFEYRHPNGESHTVTVSRDQVINEMPDFLFEALCSKLCNCEPAGETNVVECCCDEYAEEFKLLAAAPVCRPSRNALTDAQMRRLYENSTETENERLGFAAFARLIRRAEAVHQIAAAPQPVAEGE
ncbi:hypothetical protein [Pseudomonas aeruginosa]|uniref:hypothetical protein n=1 Tax=Pseudomonas aeruginosa TaxID=287 RepID=UPI000F53F43E|nr:hypothetical protein [Pseudomonas aeruginosa]